jgi:hypothetical protein
MAAAEIPKTPPPQSVVSQQATVNEISKTPPLQQYFQAVVSRVAAKTSPCQQDPQALSPLTESSQFSEEEQDGMNNYKVVQSFSLSLAQLATLLVYGSLYKIAIVQNVIRRHQAIRYAADRMAFVIQSQSLARGFLTRRRMFWQYYAATIIQATWRGTSNRLKYQLSLLDIAVAQSVVRRKLARLEFYRQGHMARLC